jgi:hypothetical protein
MHPRLFKLDLKLGKEKTFTASNNICSTHHKLKIEINIKPVSPQYIGNQQPLLLRLSETVKSGEKVENFDLAVGVYYSVLDIGAAAAADHKYRRRCLSRSRSRSSSRVR